MTITELSIGFGTSILIGALIGLEREKTRQLTKGTSAVGIRTDILIALFGAVSAFLGNNFSPWLFLICLVAMLILTISSYIYLSIAKKRVGITTEISTILVFLLGGLTMTGYQQMAVILAIIVTFILSLRSYLRKAITSINYNEIYDTVKFAIIAFIILPFLPNKDFDQQIFHNLFPAAQIPETFNTVSVLNPYKIWFLVVLVSGVSFVGYFLVKTIGKRKGIGIMGLIGGIYSSTTTSLTLAEKSKAHLKTINPFVAGIVLACGISFIRTFIQLRALNEHLFARALAPLGLMFIYLMCIGLYFLFKKSPEEKITENDKFKTPFELKKALKLAGFITLALLIGKLVLTYSDINLYYILASAMAFFAIDDPIVIATASNAGALINYEEAKNVILLVTFLNMIQKVALIYFFGNRKLLKPMVKIYGGLFLVTLGGFLYL